MSVFEQVEAVWVELAYFLGHYELWENDRQIPPATSTAVLSWAYLDEGWLVPREATSTPPMRDVNDTAYLETIGPINV